MVSWMAKTMPTSASRIPFETRTVIRMILLRHIDVTDPNMLSRMDVAGGKWDRDHIRTQQLTDTAGSLQREKITKPSWPSHHSPMRKSRAARQCFSTRSKLIHNVGLKVVEANCEKILNPTHFRLRSFFTWPRVVLASTRRSLALREGFVLIGFFWTISASAMRSFKRSRASDLAKDLHCYTAALLVD